MASRLQTVLDHLRPSLRGTGDFTPLPISSAERRVPVVLNANVLMEIRDRGNLNYGVPAGRAGNNNPESRRNRMVQALCKKGEAELTPASAAEGLTDAKLVHSAGFVSFLENAFQRWETELHKDASYVLPNVTEAAEVALVPFHCVKSAQPRGAGLSAEFACYASDFETPIFESTAGVLKDDLGVVVAAVERIQRQERAVYALTTHAGHHAGPSYFSGFCYINNASIACELLEKSQKCTALIDLDFHGGNGSFDIAQTRGRWFRSINCASAYPWVDMGESGVELPPGTRWSDGYASALEKVLRDLPAKIDVLVVSLGYDTLGSDPEAGKRAGVGLSLQASDFYAMSSLLARTGLPLLIVQEGGYDLDQIPNSFSEFVRGLSSK